MKGCGLMSRGREAFLRSLQNMTPEEFSERNKGFRERVQQQKVREVLELVVDMIPEAKRTSKYK